MFDFQYKPVWDGQKPCCYVSCISLFQTGLYQVTKNPLFVCYSYIIDSAGGWQSTDVYKTVVLKFSTSVLLTQYVNATHIQGLAIVPSVGGQTFPVDNWYMVDLGFNHTTVSISRTP